MERQECVVYGAIFMFYSIVCGWKYNLYLLRMGRDIELIIRCIGVVCMGPGFG